MNADRHPIVVRGLALLLTALQVGCAAEVQRDPVNHVVVVIDGSGSYRTRQEEAVARASQLLDEMTQKRLHRWDKGSDHITVISLDAIPEVLWEGSGLALKEMDTNVWRAHFAARTDYANCTDVTAAFHLAARYLEGDPRYVHKYLFVFSDLLNEPPTSSISKCARAGGRPDADFPWTALHDVSTAVFWMPPNQKLEWRRAATEHGVGDNLALYTTSESGQVEIAPPPTPKLERSEAEVAADKERVVRTGMSVLTVVGIGFVVTMVLVIGGALLAGRRRRRLPANRPEQGGGRGRQIPIVTHPNGTTARVNPLGPHRPTPSQNRR